MNPMKDATTNQRAPKVIQTLPPEPGRSGKRSTNPAGALVRRNMPNERSAARRGPCAATHGLSHEQHRTDDEEDRDDECFHVITSIRENLTTRRPTTTAKPARSAIR